jgi:hypothetical protein
MYKITMNGVKVIFRPFSAGQSMKISYGYRTDFLVKTTDLLRGMQRKGFFGNLHSIATTRPTTVMYNDRMR